MSRIIKGWMILMVLSVGMPYHGGRTANKQFVSSRLTSELFRTTHEAKGGVRAELIRMQAQDGLTIAWYDPHGLEIVKFDKRTVLQGKNVRVQFAGGGTISRDGTQIAFQLRRPTKDPALTLGIMKADNTDLREFLNVVSPGQMCWSNDMAYVAMLTVIKNMPSFSLKVLDLESQSVRDIAPAERITSQCWSPDGKEIVFESGGNVMVQSVEVAKPRALAVGSGPTWSPDGNWIAYLDKHEHSYYVIHPSGEGKKKLFHRRNGMAGLYWSPDARIVAYVVEEGFLFMDVETYRLRVRRLEDDSDDWVANEDIGCCENIQWVTSKELLRHIESQAAPK
jgi:dipeptidyl aminopeptidase/acylaminoacyl peptidase